jgi:hypothetical protein
MFDSLDDKIKHDEAVEKSPREQFVQGVAVAILSVVGFFTLLMAVGMLS